MTTKKTDDNKTVAQKEAEGVDTVTITVQLGDNDVELTLPADINDAPYAVMENLEHSRVTSAVVALIGDKQMSKVRVENPSNAQINSVWEAYADATGLGK